MTEVERRPSETVSGGAGDVTAGEVTIRRGGARSAGARHVAIRQGGAVHVQARPLRRGLTP